MNLSCVHGGPATFFAVCEYCICEDAVCGTVNFYGLLCVSFVEF
jgi:hypothetical protein